MRCQFCGREAQPGQVYCECGHPISLSGGSDPYAVSNGFPTPPSDYDKQWMTPDGRSLSSLQKKPGMGVGAKIVLIIIVLAILGAGGFLAYKLIKGGDVLDEGSWKTIDGNGFSITLPSALKESDNIIELNKSAKKLGFYKGKSVAAHITKTAFTSQEKQIVQQNGLDAVKQNIIAQAGRRKINGQQLVPKERGNLIVVEYSAQRKNYIEDTDKVWVIDGMLITDSCIYEVELYCPESDKSKYTEAMYKWLDSFKGK